MSQKSQINHCEICDYTCGKSSDMSKHILTRKHKNRTNIEPKLSQTFSCKRCGKEYCARNSLWYHERKCGNEIKCEKTEPIEPNPYVNIIDRLLTDNQELRNFIIEQSKTTNETMNKVIEHNVDVVNKVLECRGTTNNIQNNNKFNINVFLNEQCKDAINFSDFIKNIEISRADLANTGQLGFVDGISKILLDNLKQLSVSERPIHCTDMKRETMYIKDDDKWNKEEDDSKLRNAIQTVSRKSMRTLIDWKEVNPDYKDGDSEFSIQCLSMQRHSVAGDDRDVCFPKVARLVAKEVTVDKV